MISNIFQKVYNSIINQQKLKNKKWIFYQNYNMVEKYYSKKHVLKRLKERYPNYYQLLIDNILNSFIDEMNSSNFWKIKDNDIKRFTFHAKKSNIWLAGVYQLDNNLKRIYVATLLPSNKTRYNKKYCFIELDI